MLRREIWYLFWKIWAKVKNFLRLSHLQESNINYLTYIVTWSIIVLTWAPSPKVITGMCEVIYWYDSDCQYTFGKRNNNFWRNGTVKNGCENNDNKWTYDFPFWMEKIFKLIISVKIITFSHKNGSEIQIVLKWCVQRNGEKQLSSWFASNLLVTWHKRA